MPRRVSSPDLVGRHAELSQLQAAIEEAGGGESRVVLVAGEAGVGKSRLVNEVATWAYSHDHRVLRGSCVNLGAGSAPLAPILEALRPIARTWGRHEIEELVGPAGVRLLGLDRRAVADPSTKPTGIGLESAHGQLLESLLALFAGLATRQPTVFVCEDLQWVDRSTLDVVTVLARGLADSRLAMVLTLRTDEPQVHRDLLPFIAELSRLERFERVDLGRLNRGDVARQVAAIRGTPASADLVEAIFERSQGNPFFAEELLATPAGGGTDALPATLEAVLRARVIRLGRGATELVRAASVAGSRFSEALLAELLGQPMPAFRAALRESLAEHIVTREHGSRGEELGFRHALVRDLLYADLPHTERRELHVGWARLLEEELSRDSDVGLASQLAHHWDAAGEAERALDASVRAAHLAESVGARPEAAMQYERVLDLTADDAPAQRIGGFDRVELLERAAANRLDDPLVSVAHIKAALGLADQDDAIRIGLLQAALGRYLWFAGDGAAALAACREAVRLVPPDPPSAARARVLASLGQILMILQHATQESVAACEEAVALAEATGERAIEGHALNTLGILTAYGGDVEGGIERLQAALRIAQEIGDRLNEDRAYSNHVDVLIYAAARYADAVDVARQPLRDRDARHPSLHDGLLRAELIAALYMAGRWQEAALELERARLGRHRGAAEIALQVREAQLLVGRGELEGARRRVEAVEQLLRGAADTQWISPASLARAELELWDGDPQAALEAMTDGLGRVTATTGANVSRIGPMLAMAIRAAGDVVSASRGSHSAVAAEARSHAETFVSQMRSTRTMIAETWPAHRWLADAYLALCEAEAGRADGASDAVAWAAAAEGLDDLGQPYSAAYARFRHAEALLTGRRAATRAKPILRVAHDVAQRLGAGPLSSAIEKLARAARIDLQPLDGAHHAQWAAGLSPREHEVLALVVAGLTNRQIADRLFISPKTASHHVSSILAKLGVGRRSEAAAEAMRLGIVPPPTGQDAPSLPNQGGEPASDGAVR